jgi:alpha-beta hydrolase superfamily lysophospholipase
MAGAMTTVILVHGAWHGPWCWDDVAQRLAEHGHDVHALALRGHDGPTGRIWHRVRDYVDDLRAVVSDRGCPRFWSDTGRSGPPVGQAAGPARRPYGGTHPLGRARHVNA